LTLERYAVPPSERIELRFNGTYYFVYQLDAYVSRQSILSREFSDEFDEGLSYYVTPFQRWTSLHVFTEFFIRQVLHEDEMRALRAEYVRRGSCSDKYSPHDSTWLLSVDLMKSHGYDVASILKEFDGWHERNARCCPPVLDDAKRPDFDVLDEAVEDGSYAELLRQLTEEVFFVLFGNRTFLYKFHAHLAHWVLHSEASVWLPENDLFRKDTELSILKRVRIPEWAKRAVFFRDRGHCCLCERDLGGGYSPVNRAEYDHIVPLARGGVNDVTNLQLLCKECNNQKRATEAEPGRMYERWFPTERSAEYRFVPNLASVIASIIDGQQGD
jgi:hypothetical protein